MISSKPTVTAFVALGSNLGDRAAFLERAVAAIERLQLTAVAARSSVRETEPEGRTGQPRFLNAVAEIATALPARDLLRRLLAVERSLGRVRDLRWGPRTIDLDLLLYGDEIICTAELEIPHPRMTERRFVLEPLAEMAPGRSVPGTGRTIREWLNLVKTKNPKSEILMNS